MPLNEDELQCLNPTMRDHAIGLNIAERLIEKMEQNARLQKQLAEARRLLSMPCRLSTMEGPCGTCVRCGAINKFLEETDSP